MPQPVQQSEYTYNGPAYIRPTGRGVVLLEEGKPGTIGGEHLADVLNWTFGTGTFDVEITIRALPQKEKT